MSSLTTHVLDTSLGKPAEGIAVSLEHFENNQWKKIGEGITNSDGRINNLLTSDVQLKEGIFRLVFETSGYFGKQNKKTFYPKVTIEFSVTDQTHYHVPLLLNPFGFSTYRGS